MTGSFSAGKLTDTDEDEQTYRIVRKCFDSAHAEHNMVVATGLTLDEAQEHCNDEATHGEDSERGMWFDCYNKE